VSPGAPRPFRATLAGDDQRVGDSPATPCPAGEATRSRDRIAAQPCTPRFRTAPGDDALRRLPFWVRRRGRPRPGEARFRSGGPGGAHRGGISAEPGSMNALGVPPVASPHHGGRPGFPAARPVPRRVRASRGSRLLQGLDRRVERPAVPRGRPGNGRPAGAWPAWIRGTRCSPGAAERSGLI